MSIINNLDSRLDNGDGISVFCILEDNYIAMVGLLTAGDNDFVLSMVQKRAILMV